MTQRSGDQLNRVSSRRAVLVAIALAVTLAVAWWIRGQLLIDRCLDSGGRWDYDSAECER